MFCSRHRPGNERHPRHAAGRMPGAKSMPDAGKIFSRAAGETPRLGPVRGDPADFCAGAASNRDFAAAAGSAARFQRDCWPSPLSGLQFCALVEIAFACRRCDASHRPGCVFVASVAATRRSGTAAAAAAPRIWSKENWQPPRREGNWRPGAASRWACCPCHEHRR